jgi:hypothetical protein
MVQGYLLGVAGNSRPAVRAAGWTARILIGLALLVAGPGHDAAFAQGDRAACRLVAPQEWQDAPVEWIGPCTSGLAHGPGVAITRPPRGAQQNFFGNAVRGHLAEGVLDLPNGYKPARVKDDAFVALDDRNQIIAAFRVAANAARQVSARYRAAGDAKAARAYAEIAERLANQLD